MKTLLGFFFAACLVARADLILIDEHGQRLAACPALNLAEIFYLKVCPGAANPANCTTCTGSVLNQTPFVDFTANLNVAFGIPATYSGHDALDRLNIEISDLSSEIELVGNDEDGAALSKRLTEKKRIQRKLIRLNALVIRPLREAGVAHAIDAEATITPDGRDNFGLVRASFDKLLRVKGSVYRITRKTAQSFPTLCTPPFVAADLDDALRAENELKGFLEAREEKSLNVLWINGRAGRWVSVGAGPMKAVRDILLYSVFSGTPFSFIPEGEYGGLCILKEEKKL
ncbi:MAG: hypothetical protein HYR96_01060 [Deltaproteobacteria bacterium]|nr:hypothetical protein [Deltaproteobacteria bacterium]MBI3293433.1 hypothetical protein [Deltaproteobacteria bacterium]